jgi:hypothetical protein
MSAPIKPDQFADASRHDLLLHLEDSQKQILSLIEQLKKKTEQASYSHRRTLELDHTLHVITSHVPKKELDEMIARGRKKIDDLTEKIFKCCHNCMYMEQVHEMGEDEPDRIAYYEAELARCRVIEARKNGNPVAIAIAKDILTEASKKLDEARGPDFFKYVDY